LFENQWFFLGANAQEGIVPIYTFPQGNHLLDARDGNGIFCDIGHMSAEMAERLLLMGYINPMTPRKSFRDTVAAHRRRMPSSGYAILEAHGAVRANRWVFSAEGKHGSLRPVQEWVSKYDGAYPALLIVCCNPAGLGICADKSVVIHFNAECRSMGELLKLRSGALRFYMPGEGYVEKRMTSVRLAKRRAS
jgi:hypothetical protein